MPNPEQPVLDAIDDLVDWQIAEGRKRGDDLPEMTLHIRIPTGEELDEFRRQHEELRRLVDVPPDAPYQEFREFERGERVGWQDAHGTVHVGVVESHVEDPPDSGQWTMTLADGADTAAKAAERLAAVARVAETLTRSRGGSSSSV